MSADDIDDSSAPLIEHLAELRNRLMISLGAFIVAMVVCFTIWNPIFHFLTQPICSSLAERSQECHLVLIKLQEGFFVAMRISIFGGFVLSFPVIATQLWRFVAPGLYKSEKGAFLPFLIASPVMFFLGAAFAFYVIMPMAYSFFLGFQEMNTDPANVKDAGILFQGSMEEYLSLTIKFIIAFGLSFQLPVLLTLMGKAGLVSAAGLGAVRKYAVVAILVLAAVATPPDVPSQVILFTVIYGLYEISILLVRRVEKKREADLRAQGLWVDDDEYEEDDSGEEVK